MKVIRIGEKTPNPFIVACDKFIYIEIIANKAQKKENKDSSKNSVDKITKREISSFKTPYQIYQMYDGWAFLEMLVV